MLKLDLGAGVQRLPGYIPIDYSLGHDIRALPFRDDSVDEIRASHVLEHISFREAHATLQHWFAVLKPGGIMRIAVPDFDKIVDWYKENRGGEMPIECYLMGGHADQSDVHKAIYQRQKLADLMAQIGLEDIKEWTGVDDDCSSLPVSLNLQGRKPHPAIPAEPPRYADVHMTMTSPRLGFTENMFCVSQACIKLGMTMTRTSGVFWTQGIDRSLSDAIARPEIKWVMTTDYDTCFTWQDVVQLRTLAEKHDCEILVPMQAGRERSCPLFTMRDEQGNLLQKIEASEMDKEVLPIATGHFGLTIISADALRKLSKPWFLGEPAPDGTWGEGRVDDDIYFWKKWHQSGRKAWLTPKVRVGHMEMVVSWAGYDLMTRYQKVTEWHSQGKPWYARS